MPEESVFSSPSYYGQSGHPTALPTPPEILSPVNESINWEYMSLGFRRNSTQSLTLAFGPNTNRTQTLSWSIGGIGDFKPEYSSGWFPEYIQGSGTAEGVKVIVDKMSYNISSATFSPESNIESSSYYNFSTDVESYYNLFLVIVEKSTNKTVLSKRLYLSGG